MDITAIAKNFTEFYYSQFALGRLNLAPLYRPHSMMTWEGKQFQGGANIVQHLNELPFEKVAHKISTFDAQPSSLDMSTLLISVTGLLRVDGDQELQFSQVFVLAKEGESFYVLNDMFRLNLG
ncbi:nuclear transport factor 2 [Suillus plorans]|uniref:Nuclear transport factor 2 n=1 Tax=Suillus plorans TaxID=116603 RepID=A0A9P7ALK3_9AGAM|nr:nuclear transport factor 2 [Suillus plorans]KAG1790874.1 nuclear transport factor 2 [Suillus plorans]